jgi:hypothetical protein
VSGLTGTPGGPSDLLHLLLTRHDGADCGLAGGISSRRDSGSSNNGRKHGHSNCDVTHGRSLIVRVDRIADLERIQYAERVTETVTLNTHFFGLRAPHHTREPTFSFRAAGSNKIGYVTPHATALSLIARMVVNSSVILSSSLRLYRTHAGKLVC